MKIIGTFYLSQSPKLVALRNRLASFQPDKNWVDKNDATNFEIPLDAIAKWRRKSAVFVAGRAATYARPFGLEDPSQFEVSLRNADANRVVLVNTNQCATRDLSRYKDVRLHTTGGDVPGYLYERVHNDSDIDGLISATILHFDFVAACRAIGAGSSLTHPILVWQDQATGAYHWYARGYDAIAFSLVPHALNVHDSEGAAFAAPVIIDVSPYSPYEGLHYDIAFVDIAKANISNAATVGRALQIAYATLREMRAVTGTPRDVIAHHELTDPFGLSSSDCRALLRDATEGVVFSVPADASDAEAALQQRTISQNDLVAVPASVPERTIQLHGRSYALAAQSKFARIPQEVSVAYDALRDAVGNTLGMCNAWISRVAPTVTPEWVSALVSERSDSSDPAAGYAGATVGRRSSSDAPDVSASLNGDLTLHVARFDV